MKPECIYIACRLTSTHPIEYLYNLKQSFKAAAELWRKGHYPFTPGLDLHIYFELDGRYGAGGRLPYAASLEWLRRCDSVLILNGLEDSRGVQLEHKEAQRLGMKTYYSFDEIPEALI